MVAAANAVDASTNGRNGHATASPGAAQTVDSVPAMLFRRWTMPELLGEPDTFHWHVRGLLCDPTYGQIGGEMKTMKSTVATFVQVGLAAGVNIFDHFVVDRSRPVIAYVGEGGRSLYRRRTERVARAMGVDLADIPLYPSFDVAPIGSLMFAESLARDLREIEPGLVSLDPLYVYHGTQTKASDLHQEGALLTRLSKPCMDAGASLQVVNHFNQTGSGVNLKRITMAGSGEWADSWVLLAHREPPDVANGAFKLTMEIGSRQWGGTSWELDLDIGRFDMDAGVHDGDISWELRRAAVGGVTAEKQTEANGKARTAILDAVADMPWEKTKTELKVLVGGSREAFTAAFNALADEGRISHNKIRRTEAGIEKERPLWGLSPTRADENRPGSDVEDF